MEKRLVGAGREVSFGQTLAGFTTKSQVFGLGVKVLMQQCGMIGLFPELTGPLFGWVQTRIHTEVLFTPVP
jgi:hypothetical protein